MVQAPGGFSIACQLLGAELLEWGTKKTESF